MTTYEASIDSVGQTCDSATIRLTSAALRPRRRHDPELSPGGHRCARMTAWA